MTTGYASVLASGSFPSYVVQQLHGVLCPPLVSAFAFPPRQPSSVLPSVSAPLISSFALPGAFHSAVWLALLFLTRVFLLQLAAFPAPHVALGPAAAGHQPVAQAEGLAYFLSGCYFVLK